MCVCVCVSVCVSVSVSVSVCLCLCVCVLQSPYSKLLTIFLKTVLIVIPIPIILTTKKKIFHLHANRHCVYIMYETSNSYIRIYF